MSVFVHRERSGLSQSSDMVKLILSFMICTNKMNSSFLDYINENNKSFINTF